MVFDTMTAQNANGGRAADSDETARQTRKQLLEEQMRGEFGPATRAALQKTVDWLEKQQLPEYLTYLKEHLIPNRNIIPGQPNQIENGRVNLGIAADKLPDYHTLDRLYSSLEWLNNSAKLVKENVEREQQLEAEASKAEMERISQTVTKAIQEQNLPQGWLKPENVPTEEWLPKAVRLVNAAVLTKTQIEIADDINKISDGQIALNLPANAHTQRSFWQDKLERVKLDLPQSWMLDTPQDQRRLDALEEFSKTEKARLTPLVEKLKEGVNNPVKAISWGDWEIAKSRAHFDEKGNLIGITDRKSTLDAGASAQDMNLLESRYDVTSNPQTDKLTVKQTVQAQNVPIWGYQNLAYDNVGKPLHLQHEFSPNEWVAVRRGSEFELMKASDLNWNATVESIKLRGGTTAMIALDGAMIVTGTAALASAAKGARIMLTATEVATATAETTLTASNAARLIARTGKGVLATSAGATGLVDNAGGHEHEGARTLLLGRTLYFGAQSARLLTSPLFRNLNAAKDGKAIMAGPEGANALIEQTRAQRVLANIDRSSQYLSAGTTGNAVHDIAQRQRRDRKGRAAAERVVDKQEKIQE